MGEIESYARKLGSRFSSGKAEKYIRSALRNSPNIIPELLELYEGLDKRARDKLFRIVSDEAKSSKLVRGYLLRAYIEGSSLAGAILERSGYPPRRDLRKLYEEMSELSAKLDSYNIIDKSCIYSSIEEVGKTILSGDAELAITLMKAWASNASRVLAALRDIRNAERPHDSVLAARYLRVLDNFREESARQCSFTELPEALAGLYDELRVLKEADEVLRDIRVVLERLRDRGITSTGFEEIIEEALSSESELLSTLKGMYRRLKLIESFPKLQLSLGLSLEEFYKYLERLEQYPEYIRNESLRTLEYLEDEGEPSGDHLKTLYEYIVKRKAPYAFLIRELPGLFDVLDMLYYNISSLFDMRQVELGGIITYDWASSSKLLIFNTENTLALADISGRVIWRIPLSERPIFYTLHTRTGYVAVASKDGVVKLVWNGEVRWRKRLKGSIIAMGFNYDASSLLVAVEPGNPMVNSRVGHYGEGGLVGDQGNRGLAHKPAVFLYSLSVPNGQVVWKRSIKDAVLDSQEYCYPRPTLFMSNEKNDVLLILSTGCGDVTAILLDRDGNIRSSTVFRGLPRGTIYEGEWIDDNRVVLATASCSHPDLDSFYTRDPAREAYYLSRCLCESVDGHRILVLDVARGRVDEMFRFSLPYDAVRGFEGRLRSCWRRFYYVGDLHGDSEVKILFKNIKNMRITLLGFNQSKKDEDPSILELYDNEPVEASWSENGIFAIQLGKPGSIYLLRPPKPSEYCGLPFNTKDFLEGKATPVQPHCRLLLQAIRGECSENIAHHYDLLFQDLIQALCENNFIEAFRIIVLASRLKASWASDALALLVFSPRLVAGIRSLASQDRARELLGVSTEDLGKLLMKTMMRKTRRTRDYKLLYDDVTRLLGKLWSGLYAGLYFDNPEKQFIIEAYMKAWREKHAEASIEEIIEALEDAYLYALYDKYRDNCPTIVLGKGKTLLCNLSDQNKLIKIKNMENNNIEEFMLLEPGECLQASPTLPIRDSQNRESNIGSH